uniref:Ig-like domain-containing protein n=1 Tax=Leptobrachium leishanense TaxID=445787 RepID=A0A8C5MCT8_9ANUR
MTNLLGYLLLGMIGCAHGQISLIPSGNGFIKPTESLQLTCKVNGYIITTDYWWQWIKQSTEKELEWLGGIRYSGSTSYNAAFQNRVSVTMDSSKNEYSLQLQNTKEVDSGVYYCVRGTVGKSVGYA